MHIVTNKCETTEEKNNGAWKEQTILMSLRGWGIPQRRSRHVVSRKGGVKPTAFYQRFCRRGKKVPWSGVGQILSGFY